MLLTLLSLTSQEQYERAACRGRIPRLVNGFYGKGIVGVTDSIHKVEIYTGGNRQRTQHAVHINLILDVFLRINIVSGFGPCQPNFSTSIILQETQVGRSGRRRDVATWRCRSIDNVARCHVTTRPVSNPNAERIGDLTADDCDLYDLSSLKFRGSNFQSFCSVL